MSDSTNNVSPTSDAQQKPSQFGIFTDIFTAPSKAYTDIQHNHQVLLPFITVILSSCIMIIFMFSNLDYSWYVDHLVDLQLPEGSNEAKGSMRDALLNMSASTMGYMGAVMAGAMIGGMFVLQSLYFMIISKVTNDGIEFKQWFSFVSWSSLPSLLSVLGILITIVSTGNGQFLPESVDPTTINALLFHMDPSKGLGALLIQINLAMFWTIAIMTIGYANWTGKNKSVAFTIVVLPYILYFSIRFLLV